MELRTYWSIILRRAWVIVLVVGVVSLYAAYQYYHLRKTPGDLKVYQSSAVIQVGLQATTKLSDPNYADYITATETLSDVLTTSGIFTAPSFDNAVIQQIQADSHQIAQRYGANPDLGNLSPGAIGGALSASRDHNLVTLRATWPTQAGAWAITNAVSEVIAAHIDTYVSYINGQAVTGPLSLTATATATADTTGTSTANSNISFPITTAKIISPAVDNGTVPGPSASKPTLLLVLVLVSLVIGIALAFLIEYLDDRIRSQEEITRLLQLPIYGAVPRAPTPGQRSTRR